MTTPFARRRLLRAEFSLLLCRPISLTYCYTLPLELLASSGFAFIQRLKKRFPRPFDGPFIVWMDWISVANLPSSRATASASVADVG